MCHQRCNGVVSKIRTDLLEWRSIWLVWAYDERSQACGRGSIAVVMGHLPMVISVDLLLARDPKLIVRVR